MLFKDLSPLCKGPEEMGYLSFNDVKQLIGGDPYGKTEKELVSEYNSTHSTPQLVFLGLDEKVKDGLSYRNFNGAPRFALDITPKGSYAQEAEKILGTLEAQGLKPLEGLRAMNFPADVGKFLFQYPFQVVLGPDIPQTAPTYAMGRALLDWNARNPYCATCGQPTLSVNGGAKRVCPPSDWANLTGGGSIGSTTSATPSSAKDRPPCSTRSTLSNLTFPRTDPTIIVAVLSHDGRRILLGRGKRFPPYWYSTLAGFIEPGESVEDAVRREVWEESGVVLSRVVIHSSQPWPYPANLMIGAIAQVGSVEDERIKLDFDPELDDAKWFPLAEVREALRVGTSGIGEDSGPGYKEGNLRLPPKTAIANQLISAAVDSAFLAGVTKI